MPVMPGEPLRRISEAEFRDIDYLVTGLAFQLHRELGPWFIDEAIFRDELAQMCQLQGLTVHKELPVVATFNSFSKPYFLDLIVNKAVPYELKTVAEIHPKHRSQVLNYLLLTGLAHAKILNMRSPSVEYEFVSTTITQAVRYTFTINVDSWKEMDDDSRWLIEAMHSFIKEWGVFLDVTLYYDAIAHFRGGKDNLIRTIDISRRGQVIGYQRAHVINPSTAVKITAMSKEVELFERRLLKFLSVTELRAIQWINFNRQDVVFKTLAKDISI